MKHKELAYHEAQVMKIRAQLDAGNTPINEISKPYGMRAVVFDRRIARLIRHEGEYRRKFHAGLANWLSSRYET